MGRSGVFEVIENLLSKSTSTTICGGVVGGGCLPKVIKGRDGLKRPAFQLAWARARPV